MVDGTRGEANNLGIVNAPQTVAFFGIDEDGNGAIDTFFFDQNQNNLFDTGDIGFETTTIISLDSTSTATQLIQAIYGNEGELGYRLGFIFDSERRFDPAFDNIQEIPNLYTTNDSTLTEGFDISVQSVLAPEAQTSVDGAELSFQTATVEQSAEVSGPFNFNSTFEKVQPFTQESLSARTDTPLVFTVVEVRNDQDINLFVGADSNSLNAVSQTLEAEIETPGMQPTVPEFAFVENVIPNIVLPDRAPDQIQVVEKVELPQVTTFERPGELSWIAVKIDDPSTDEDDDNPEVNITDVDGELILNDPLIDYQPLDPDEKPKVFEGLKRNQYKKITAAIEADSDAEVGLWYKVFIDYEDNSGKEDELLFYYYKTGEKPDAEVGADSDLLPEDSEETLPPNSNDVEELLESESANLSHEQPMHANQASEAEDESSNNQLIDPRHGDLPIAAILAYYSVAAERKSSPPVKTAACGRSSEFEHLNRLKRRFKELLRQS